ncbi:MAG: aspartate-semialdehyde dehydrogenase [Deltaproteobacteria bacterium]|nr:aspartate-semialdehyde dehydrogenase [Deltaproteobacteria bacterium]
MRENFQGLGVNIAVVGATGAVGKVLFEVLEERNFPTAEIRPLASRRSVGRKIRIGGVEREVLEARPEAFEGIDLVFFAATGALSRELAPEAVARGAIVIDKSNTWRMDAAVPLVVPEVNAARLDAHQGIIASPNCTTVGVVMALEPIRRRAGLRSAVITTLQAASGAGQPGVEELRAQRIDHALGRELRAEVFAAPIEDNVVPLCETMLVNGYSSEELKLRDETRKILGLPSLAVAMTCVRVPVEVGHSATLLVETEVDVPVVDIVSALAAFPGVVVTHDRGSCRFPTPRDVVGSDEVWVGRVRKDLDSEKVWLWQVSDNLRKGAATNAVQIAEALLERKLIGRFGAF